MRVAREYLQLIHSLRMSSRKYVRVKFCNGERGDIPGLLLLISIIVMYSDMVSSARSVSIVHKSSQVKIEAEAAHQSMQRLDKSRK